jgi:hypothetical protein
MGTWIRCLPIGLVLAIQCLALLADEATWEHHMDIGVSAAGRQDYATAEAAFAASVRELEKINPGDSRLGPAINSLGAVFRAENKLHEAEIAFRRAMAYIEKFNGPESTDVGNSNMNVGSVLVAVGKYIVAEPFLK